MIFSSLSFFSSRCCVRAGEKERPIEAKKRDDLLASLKRRVLANQTLFLALKVQNLLFLRYITPLTVVQARYFLSSTFTRKKRSRRACCSRLIVSEKGIDVFSWNLRLLSSFFESDPLWSFGAIFESILLPAMASHFSLRGITVSIRVWG